MSKFGVIQSKGQSSLLSRSGGLGAAFQEILACKRKL